MPLTLTTVVSGFSYTPLSGINTNTTIVTFNAIYSGQVIDFNAIWLFGDGTYDTGTNTSVTHVYNRPGVFNVTLIVFNTIEEFKNYLLINGHDLSVLPTSQEYVQFTRQVLVSNYISDTLIMTTSANGGLQSRCQLNPFRVEFHLSQNIVPSFVIFPTNSLSQPWNTIDQKWSHLKPQWRFLDSNFNNISTLTPNITSVSTLIQNGPNSLSAVPFNTVLPSTLVAGVSGFADFYYIDDMPNIVTLNITLDGSMYNNFGDKNYAAEPTYANIHGTPLALTTTYTVSASPPARFEITSNGLSAFTLEGTKWLNALIPYVITICDTDGFILRNYPINNTAGSVYPLIRFLDGLDSTGVAFELLSATFQQYDDLGFNVGGYYTGFFQPLSSIGVTQLRVLGSLQTNTGIVALTGASVAFDVVDYDSVYGIQKINENFDMANTIKSYALQETIARNTVLFDSLIGQIVGDINSSPDTLGKSIYEKIANFVDNHSDIDYCNIDKLYSLCQELGVPIENYNLDYPAVLRRILNILSISYSKLKGSKEAFNHDFIQTPTLSSAQNLGPRFNSLTNTITAGTKIVIHEKFTNTYELFEPVILNSQSVYPLNSLSAYNFKTPLDQYYDFYTYIPYFTNNQVEGVINWDDPMTTLVDDVSSADVWLGSSGTVIAILDYQLRRGLNLINT